MNLLILIKSEEGFYCLIDKDRAQVSPWRMHISECSANIEEWVLKSEVKRFIRTNKDFIVCKGSLEELREVYPEEFV